MTNNHINETARLIRDLSEVIDGETIGYTHAHNIAQALADAGLLQSDLPEPTTATTDPELLDEVIRLREALKRLQIDMGHQPHQYLANEVANAIQIILEGDGNT